MRFLADESCDFRVVRALRAAGHDVVAVMEVMPGASDEAVIALAVGERRIFVTEDRDFGQLAGGFASVEIPKIDRPAAFFFSPLEEQGRREQAG